MPAQHAAVGHGLVDSLSHFDLFLYSNEKGKDEFVFVLTYMWYLVVELARVLIVAVDAG